MLYHYKWPLTFPFAHCCPHRLLWLCNRFVRMSSIHIFCCASNLWWHSENPDFAGTFKLCRDNLILWVFEETFLALCLYLHKNMWHWFWYFLHFLGLFVALAGTFMCVCVFGEKEDGVREGGGGGARAHVCVCVCTRACVWTQPSPYNLITKIRRLKKEKKRLQPRTNLNTVLNLK